MLAAIAALLVCQLIREAAVRAVDLPFPGPVVGMILLFVLMLARAPLPVRSVIPPTVSSSICRCCSCRRASAWCSISNCSAARGCASWLSWC
jgi:hypothetical protein